MNELSLFTGAGGGVLGSKLLGWRTIAYVENNEYAQRIIRRRIDDGTLDLAPIYNDVRTFASIAREYRGVTDVLTAGFPCQPFSIASKTREAGDDERNMWPATIEIIRKVKPKICFLENVRGLLSAGTGGVEDYTGRSLSSYFGTVLRDLANAGYDARWCLLGADDVGGWHQRQRLWVRCELSDSDSAAAQPAADSQTQLVANGYCAG